MRLRNHHTRTGFILFIFLVLLLKVHGDDGSDLIVLPDLSKGESFPLSGHGQWYYDAPGDMLPEELLNAPFQSTPPENLGQRSGRLWLRYSLTSSVDQSLILHSHWHKVRRLQLYHLGPQGLELVQQTGLEIPLAERALPYRRPALEIFLEADQVHHFYLAMESKTSMRTNFELSRISGFLEKNLGVEYFLAFYFGVIIIMLLYNLVVYVASRDSNYLRYSLYVLFLLLYQIGVEGVGATYIWGGWSWFIDKSYNFFIGLAYGFGILFTLAYLELKKSCPGLFKLGRILAIAFFVTGALFLVVPPKKIYWLGNISILSGMVYFLYCGIHRLRQGYSPARFFVLAWSMLALGIFATTAARLGWLPYGTLTEYGLHLGSMLEVTLLAAALGDRVRFVQREKLQAEEALTEANQKILQNRMRPHFLFNTMNIIFSQLREAPKEAQITLTRLSDNYHYLTETQDKNLVPLQKEWEFLENYLDLMAQRWPGELHFDIELNPKLQGLPIPPMTLQPLAENAFKYALKSLTEKQLWISGELIQEMVVIKILHRSFRPLTNVDRSRSLDNIQNRLRRYYPQALLTLEQQEDMIECSITFPFPGADR